MVMKPVDGHVISGLNANELLDSNKDDSTVVERFL